MFLSYHRQAWILHELLSTSRTVNSNFKGKRKIDLWHYLVMTVFVQKSIAFFAIWKGICTLNMKTKTYLFSLQDFCSNVLYPKAVRTLPSNAWHNPEFLALGHHHISCYGHRTKDAWRLVSLRSPDVANEWWGCSVKLKFQINNIFSTWESQIRYHFLYEIQI